MKSIAKKTLCLLLALLMLLPLVVSCRKDIEDDETDSDSAIVENGEESVTETSKYDEYDDIGEMDLGGRKFIIAQPNMNTYANEIDVDRMTGDIVYDAIYKRNAEVERRLKCDVVQLALGGTEADTETILNDLEENVLGESVEYDAILNTCFTTCGAVTRGYFKDLNTVNNINLTKRYWAGFINDAMEVGGIQYTASGAISLSFYRMVWITIVHNGILKETTGEIPNLIKIVEDGKWTLKYQKTLAEQYSAEGETVRGFVSGTSSEVDPYVTSAELTFLAKGSDGFLSWGFDNTKASKVMDDIIALFKSPASTIGADHLATFVQRKALMSTQMFSDLENEDLRNMTEKYTVLPIPKFTEDQKLYHSSLNDYFSVVAIPVTVSDRDIENVGAVLEVMSSESWRTVAPAYYEVALKVKYVDNPDAWGIMDHIIENVAMDPCMPYIRLINFSGESRETLMQMWRWTTAQAVNYDQYTMGSNFNASLPGKIENSLNGPDGFQTHLRNLLANG